MRSVVWVLLISGVAGQSCSLCPSGSSIDDFTKLLIDKTCGDHEGSVSEFQTGDADCDAAVALVNDEFDVTAYCCVGVDAPQTCDVCEVSGGMQTNPTALLPNTPGTTCARVATLAEYTIKTESCTLLQDRASPTCCSAFVCKLCPTDLLAGYGGEITEPEKMLPSNEEGLTCGDLDVLIRETTQEKCPAALQELNKDFDYSRYCGCQGLDSMPPTCDFCGALPVTDPTVVIPEQDGITCDYANDVAPFIVNQDNCTSLAEDRSLCCDFTNPVCDLCPNGQTYSNPDRKTMLDPTNDKQTCQDYDEDIFQLSYVTTLSCSKFRADIQKDFDMRAYCGCPNTAAPANPVCPLCDSAKETVNDNVTIPGVPSTTCQDLAEYALYVRDDTMCLKNVEKHHDLCCEVTAVDPAPAPKPLTTPAPTLPDVSGATAATATATMVAAWTTAILLGAAGMA